MQAALQKCVGYTKSQFPPFDEYEAWMGADLMIKGIPLAGKVPTSSAVIKSLRSSESYDGIGILAKSINHSTTFGHDPLETRLLAGRVQGLRSRHEQWKGPVEPVYRRKRFVGLRYLHLPSNYG